MPEKVIHEIRFIETDDGFRIEIKGDKERIRKMGFGPGMGFREHSYRRGPRHGHAFRRGFGFGPWWWFDEPEAEPPTDEKEASQGE